MSTAGRRERILELLSGSGYLAIDELVSHFGVSPQTLRTDLNRLADEGRLIRHHGGASIPSSVANSAYASRRGEFAREKARIAERVAQWLPDRSSLFLTAGTTMLAVAQALKVRHGLKIVTPHLEAAQALAAQPHFEVVLLGGRLEPQNWTVRGTATLAALERYRADCCVFSVGGVAPDGTLLDYNDAEVDLVRAMFERSRRRLLVIDHSKFGRTASVRVGTITEVEAIATDQPLPGAMRRLLKGRPVELVLARTR
jgi:DeoR family glycerol-3-phosphate regulon repressor